MLLFFSPQKYVPILSEKKTNFPAYLTYFSDFYYEFM